MGTPGNWQSNIPGQGHITQADWTDTPADKPSPLPPLQQEGDLIVGGPNGAPQRLAEGAEDDILTIGADGPEWAPGAGGGMTNPMTTAGDIITAGTDGTPQRLAEGAEDQVLTIGADGPEWATPSGGATAAPVTSYLTANQAIDDDTEITSITLTPGTWQITANLSWSNGGSSADLAAWLSTTSAGGTPLTSAQTSGTSGEIGSLSLNAPVVITEDTTYYLNAYSTLAVYTAEYETSTGSFAKATGITAIQTA